MSEIATVVPALRTQVHRVIAGQESVVEQILIALLADGHVLLEGVPGVAKTLLVRTLSHVTSLEYSRVQFTPDMMPTDVIGTMVFDPKSTEFTLRKGPVFTNLLLADEINRTTPKTQSALLEAMEERSVTIDGTTHALPNPFLVFATQNPIDFEGTYPLPEAQQDRFLLKVLVDYPARETERLVLQRHHEGLRPQTLDQIGLETVTSAEGIRVLQKEASETSVPDGVMDYILGIVHATRENGSLQLGASPRASIALLRASKARARLQNREYVNPDDVKQLVLPVLRHRILLRPEAEIEGESPDSILNRILQNQIVPR